MKINRWKINKQYFNMLRVADDYIEIMSKNTKHCWIIYKTKSFIDSKPIIIYHKHYKQVPYYHRHGVAYNDLQAIEKIMSHDEYVLSGMVKYNK